MSDDSEPRERFDHLEILEAEKKMTKLDELEWRVNKSIEDGSKCINDALLAKLIASLRDMRESLATAKRCAGNYYDLKDLGAEPIIAVNDIYDVTREALRKFDSEWGVK
jgi:hypothetical protein